MERKILEGRPLLGGGQASFSAIGRVVAPTGITEGEEPLSESGR